MFEHHLHHLRDHAGSAVATVFGLAAAAFDETARTAGLAIALSGLCFSAVHLYFAAVRFWWDARDRWARVRAGLPTWDRRHADDGDRRHADDGDRRRPGGHR